MKTIGLKNKKLLEEAAIVKGLFLNLEIKMASVLSVTDRRDIFHSVFLKENGTVILELIAEDQPGGDEIHTEVLPESDFWNILGLDREDWINHEDETVKLWNQVSERFSKFEDTLTLKINLG